MYKLAKQKIEQIELGDLKVSPIDAIKQELQNAGYKIGEITGRGSYVDYSGAGPMLRSRPGGETSIAGRRKAIAAFNSGGLDALILNQAGATGLSLHASEKFKDQRKRHMMIVQAEGNVDTHMQMLGRVHRTGQVVLPTYSQLVADIPAEKRPAAVLAKKMASLNANTTASRGGALTSEKMPDFLNEYGDMVAAAYIAEDPRMNGRLGHPVKMKETGGLDADDAMRKLTGRIPLLPLKEQELLYEHLEAEYDALLKQMDAAGENALEAKTLALDAKTIGRAQVVPAKDDRSPFGAAVTVEKVSAKRLGKPFRSDEVARKVAEQLGADASDITKENAVEVLSRFNGVAAMEREVPDTLAKFEVWKRGILDDIADEPVRENERQRLDAIRYRYEALRGLLPVGARITLKTSNGNLTGIVLKVEQKGKAKNPLALSTWKATIAIADASRQITLPFSRLWEDGKASSEDRFAIEVAPIPSWLEDTKQTLDRFDHLQADTREERYVATGNLLAAYDWLNNRGRIVNYTDDGGNIRQGILTPHDFDFEAHAAAKGRALSVEEVANRLRARPRDHLYSDDEAVRLSYGPATGMQIEVKRAKNVGGQFYLDRGLTDIVGDFTSRGNFMTATVASDEAISQAVARLQKLGAKFSEATEGGQALASSIDVAESQPRRGLGFQNPVLRPENFSPAAQRHYDALRRMIEQSVRMIAGPEVAVGFQQRERLVGEVAEMPPPGYAQGLERKLPRAMYHPGINLVEIALASPDPLSSSYHEAWHALELRMLNDRELDLLKAETARLRPILERVYGLTKEQAAGMAGYEVRAYAFQHFEQGRGEVFRLSPGVRGIFQRIAAVIRRLRNALRGLGFRTTEDIFAAAYRGEFADRPVQEPADLEALHMALQPRLRVVRPRPGNLPVPQITMPHETVRAALTDPNLSRRERLSGALDALLLTPSRALWDRIIDLSRLQRAAELASGQATPENLDTYLAATLYPGRAGERLVDASRNLFEPIYDEMKAHGIGRDELHEYLYARHAIERNAQIRSIDPNNNSGSGMTDAEAQQILVAAQPRQAAFDAVAATVDRVVHHNRALMEREGLEHQQTLMQWAQAYQHYVPLKGAESAESEQTGTPPRGQGFMVRRPESRRALGRFDRAGDILTNLLDQTQRTIIRAEKIASARLSCGLRSATRRHSIASGLPRRAGRSIPRPGWSKRYGSPPAPTPTTCSLPRWRGKPITSASSTRACSPRSRTSVWTGCRRSCARSSPSPATTRRFRPRATRNSCSPTSCATCRMPACRSPPSSGRASSARFSRTWARAARSSRPSSANRAGPTTDGDGCTRSGGLPAARSACSATRTSLPCRRTSSASSPAAPRAWRRRWRCSPPACSIRSPGMS